MSGTVAELLTELGGVARYRALHVVVGRDRVEAALGCGEIVRDHRGVYALPSADEARRVAMRLGGVLSHTSAALHHGWGVKTAPTKPHVTVPHGRKLGRRASLAHVHWADLAAADVVDGVAVPELTLAQCLRTLPTDEALAVADSALRETGCHQLLERLADDARGPGSRRIRDVAARATHLAANPFESVARALCHRVPGLSVEPQVWLDGGAQSCRADLGDRRLRIAIECDSFEWHGGRDALARDARRYNRMVVEGWLVLRFAYEDVTSDADGVLREAVALAELRVQRHSPSPDAA